MAGSNKGAWCVYVLICRGNYIYVGVTNNLERRLKQHEDGTGSKFVRSRRPFKLAKVTWYESGKEARQIEYSLKRMRRPEKMKALDIDISDPKHSCIFVGSGPEKVLLPEGPFKMPLALRRHGGSK